LLLLLGVAAPIIQRAARGKGYHQKSFSSDKCEDLFPTAYITTAATTNSIPRIPYIAFLLMARGFGFTTWVLKVV
jgi:hypothetical protein